MSTKQLDSGDSGISFCDHCGVRGVVCDTSDGEIVVNGSPIAVAIPAGGKVLMVGDENGGNTHAVYCDSCARVVAKGGAR
jgi:hypothetical protein